MSKSNAEEDERLNPKLAASCFDFLLIELVPMAYRVAAELAARDPPRVPDRDAENTRLYAEAVKEVGKEHGVPVVDTWTPINALAEKEGSLDRFLSDGLHLTADGYAVVTAAITQTIASQLPELHWDRLGQIYPHWADGESACWLSAVSCIVS